MTRAWIFRCKKLTAADCENIFQRKVSSAKDDCTQLKLMLSKFRKRDTVCVMRLDRLDQRMIKLVELINEFKAKGIEFVSLVNHIDITIPMGMLLFKMKADLDAAHTKGHKRGRLKT